MAIAVAQALINNVSYIAGSASTTVTISITPTAGSTLVVWVTWDSGVTGSCTVADNHNAGNYGSNGPWTDGPDAQALQIFQHNNVAGAATTITATFGAATDFRAIAVAEITGSNGGTTDGGNGQVQATPGTGADVISSGTMTNAGQPALIVGLSMNVNTATIPAAGTGFTSNASDATVVCRIESKRITTTSSTQVATFTDATGGGSNTYLTAAFIFDEATGGALAKVPPLNESSFRRPSPRPIPSGGESVQPLIKRGAGIDTSPAAWRLNPRPLPFGGDVSAPIAVAAPSVKYADASPAYSRPSLRLIPFGGEAPTPSAVPGAGIDAPPVFARPAPRPMPFGGEGVEPSAKPRAGIDTSPAAWRTSLRLVPPGGDVAAAILAPPVIGPFADASPAVRRPQALPPPDSGAVQPPQVARGGGIDTSPASWRPAPRPLPGGAEAAPQVTVVQLRAGVEASVAVGRQSRPVLDTTALVPISIRGPALDLGWVAAWRRVTRAPLPVSGEPLPGGRAPILSDTVILVRTGRRPLPEAWLPLGVLPPQTVIIVYVPAAPTMALGTGLASGAIGTGVPTEAIGLTLTAAVSLTSPTRAQ